MGTLIWLKPRRIAIAALLLLQAFGPWVASGRLVPLPNLILGTLVDTPIVALMPVFVVALLQFAFVTSDADQRRCPVHRAYLFDVALVLSVVAMGFVSGYAGLLQTDSAIYLAWTRNAMAFTGVALTARVVFRTEAMVFAALGYAIAMILFGRTTGHNFGVWAVALRPDESVEAFVHASLMLLVGLIALVTLTRRGGLRRFQFGQRVPGRA